ncbi:hypothetical protein CEE39_02210 [bacterium (candidate division B38) B3_B38]|nr:MAG: hypothetical protein CEE39_02210 [bacterium (candidate division B38) B3_B38]
MDGQKGWAKDRSKIEMERLIVNGGNRLEGIVTLSGAKNAALPILIASLLCDDEVILENVPDIEDIQTMTELIRELSIKIRREGRKIFIFPDKSPPEKIPEKLAKK